MWGTGVGQERFVQCLRSRKEGGKDAQPFDDLPPFIMVSL